MRGSKRGIPSGPPTNTSARMAAGSPAPQKDSHPRRVLPRRFAPSPDRRRYVAHVLCGPVWAALLIVSFGIPAHAQTSQVWPEISTFVKLNDRMRFYFLATTVKETRESTEGEFGPNFDFYLKPLRKKRGALHLFSPDESKTRLVMVRVGYRYIHPYTGDSPDEHRGVLELTTRQDLPGGLLASDRNRMDFRDIGGEYSWRYRNRLTIEREFSIGRVRFGPYARSEVYYDSRHDKFSRNALIGGSTFPITRHIEFEGYFEHQNDSGGSPNRTVNAVGVVVNLYF
jgi:hypothetical protein